MTFNRFLLILALVLTQASTVVHGIECLEEQHDQQCQVYVTQDHSASDIALEAQPISVAKEELGAATLANQFTSFPRSSYLSRAPPVLN